MSVVVRPPPVSGPAVEVHSLEHPTPVKAAGGIGLSELIQRARNASGEERAWLCTLINRSLAAISVAPDKDRQAALLLEMLDDEALHALEDELRVPCRAVAVEALLTIGYPWALQLEPEDVQFLRDHPATAKATLPLARIFSGFAGASALAFLAVSLSQIPGWWITQLFRSPGELALVVSLLATMVSAIPMVLGKPWLTVARWVMGISSVIATAIVASDALTQQPSVIHLLLLAIPTLGLLGTLLPREPVLSSSRPDPTLPSPP
ncbi:MAG: hypothetical protein H6Q89_1698 [Myxococcaceae bacterium]|nr:hypothetical protein [Myxococcaceae bacterium]